MASAKPSDKEKKVEYDGKKVGEVTHTYGKISVAVVAPEAVIKLGDTIKIYDRQGNEVLEQEVKSMQIEGKGVDKVKKGDDCGLEVEGDVKEGYSIYKQ